MHCSNQIRVNTIEFIPKSNELILTIYEETDFLSEILRFTYE